MLATHVIDNFLAGVWQAQGTMARGSIFPGQAPHSQRQILGWLQPHSVLNRGGLYPTRKGLEPSLQSPSL